MRQFTDEGLTTAKDRTAQLMAMLSGLRPDTDTLTRDDIRGLLCYIGDYRDELFRLQRERNKRRMERKQEGETL